MRSSSKWPRRDLLRDARRLLLLTCLSASCGVAFSARDEVQRDGSADALGDSAFTDEEDRLTRRDSAFDAGLGSDVSVGDAGGDDGHDASDASREGAIADATRDDTSMGDASTGDASTGDDASHDRFCAGAVAAFCADHDSQLPTITPPWDTSHITAGAVLTLDLKTFASAPRSLHSKVPAGTGVNTAAATVTKDLTTLQDRSVLEFDGQVVSMPTSPDPSLLQVAALKHNASDAVGIYAHSSGTWYAVVAVGTAVTSYPFMIAPAYGKFVHFSLDVTWSSTKGRVSVSLDGVNVLSRPAQVTTGDLVTRSAQVVMGLQDASGSSLAAEMLLDNVLLKLP